MTGFPSNWARTFAKWAPPVETEERSERFNTHTEELLCRVEALERPVGYHLPVQRIDSTGDARLEHRIFELERVVHELEAVILELLPAPFERSERMVDFERKRRAPDGG